MEGLFIHTEGLNKTFRDRGCNQDALRTPEVKEFIEDTYKGAVVATF
jgi:hypothetical protein